MLERFSKGSATMRRLLTVVATGALLLGGVAACSGEEASPTPSSVQGPKIGVLLPDSRTSARWETADRRYFERTFTAAGVDFEIQNAQGDKAAFASIADHLLSSGVTVLVIVSLDAETSKAVLAKAKEAGVPTIDYDRLTLGGSASYYVSFDNVAVGAMQAEGLARCLADKKVTRPLVVQLAGSPTDNNATLFRQGADAVLDKKFADGTFRKGEVQAVPGWENAEGGRIFEQMLAKAPTIGGVLAANDGLGNAAISVLKRQGLNGKVPVTGQDATVQGLQNILNGDQCMTVYKAVKKQAEETAKLAISLAQGSPLPTTQTVRDTETGRDVPAVLLTPQAIFFDSVKDVVADDYVSRADLCTVAVAEACDRAGVQ
jgi:D-xylose transport system substrate-binding protein